MASGKGSECPKGAVVPATEVMRIGIGGLLLRAEIKVDGRPCALVRGGASVRIEVAPGVHRIRARIRASESHDLSIKVSPETEIVTVILDVGYALDFSIGGPPGLVTTFHLKEN